MLHINFYRFNTFMYICILIIVKMMQLLGSCIIIAGIGFLIVLDNILGYYP